MAQAEHVSNAVRALITGANANSSVKAIEQGLAGRIA